MGIVYDPMTGEPIETPDEETAVDGADSDGWKRVGRQPGS